MPSSAADSHSPLIQPAASSAGDGAEPDYPARERAEFLQAFGGVACSTPEQRRMGHCFLSFQTRFE